VWRWISHAECLILPSRDEPFGIVLLEAALANTPVVATRVGGVPEFLTDKVHGLLCEPDRPDEMAQAVLTTLADRATTGARTRSFHEQAKGFTWQRAFARYRVKAGLPGDPI
jgi:glycosyltransferase involved in cell wall biosynthesis